MEKNKRKDKKLKIDYRGNSLLSATWGTLRIPAHLAKFGRDETPLAKKALAALSILAAVVAVVLLFLMWSRSRSGG